VAADHLTAAGRLPLSDHPTDELLEAAIAQYCTTYNLKLKHGLSDWYDVTSQWNDYLPHVGEQGCYFIYDEKKVLRYIGKVSLTNTLGSRMASYFERAPGSPGARARHTGWTCTPTYVRALAVEKAWEAPSLEEYLIHHLKPDHNTRGIRWGM
jgi:hypothetical protein